MERPCPVCGSAAYTAFADHRTDESKVNDFTYASRKEPEFMCLRMVRCTGCDLVYAPSPPDATFLSDAYEHAAYDSTIEACCAAQSYIHALSPYLAGMQQKSTAIDVGAGSGPLLPLLKRAGFQSVVGIEPSSAAIAAASSDVRPMLRQGMFTPQRVSDLRPDLICSFMTLEHILTPREFITTAFEELESGGMIAVVVHNWQGWLNRLLGLRSPIIDVEHVQLFNPKSLKLLLESAGFQTLAVKSIVNAYPVSYWLRLMPLPSSLKKSVDRCLEKLSLSQAILPMRVGNIIAVGIKHE
jgi:hypothetical protein